MSTIDTNIRSYDQLITQKLHNTSLSKKTLSKFLTVTNKMAGFDITLRTTKVYREQRGVTLNKISYQLLAFIKKVDTHPHLADRVKQQYIAAAENQLEFILKYQYLMNKNRR